MGASDCRLCAGRVECGVAGFAATPKGSVQQGFDDREQACRCRRLGDLECERAPDGGPQLSSKVLVTDFDGTITRRDFFSCVVDRLLAPEDLDPWNLYTAGEITHFEALRRMFARIRADEEALVGVMEAMNIDPDLASGIERLEDAGWDVVIVSNGCQWYIDRLLARAGVKAIVYSNPGSFDPASGLSMELPEDSPYFDPEVGISKGAVVQARLDRGETVAFAGDGRPDVDPALRVRPELRFAREWLAQHLGRAGKPYRRYEAWSDVAHMLVTP